MMSKISVNYPTPKWTPYIFKVSCPTQSENIQLKILTKSKSLGNIDQFMKILFLKTCCNIFPLGFLFIFILVLKFIIINYPEVYYFYGLLLFN